VFRGAGVENAGVNDVFFNKVFEYFVVLRMIFFNAIADSRR
jgi:hypothetical protein